MRPRRNGALTALERQGPYAVPRPHRVLHATDSDVVMFATPEKKCRPRGASRSSRHADVNVAQAAIEALGRMRAADAVPALFELLGRCSVWLPARRHERARGDRRSHSHLTAAGPRARQLRGRAGGARRCSGSPRRASLNPLYLLVRVRERPTPRHNSAEACCVVLELHPEPGAVGGGPFTATAGELESGSLARRWAARRARRESPRRCAQAAAASRSSARLGSSTCRCSGDCREILVG